jgi:hypothetical protein
LAKNPFLPFNPDGSGILLLSVSEYKNTAYSKKNLGKNTPFLCFKKILQTILLKKWRLENTQQTKSART